MTTTLPANHKRAAAIVGASITHLTDEGRATAQRGLATPRGYGRAREGYVPELPLALVIESTKNPRKHFDTDKLTQLAESIRTGGQHEPVLVRPIALDSGGMHYELASGHRRARAMRLLGRDTIAAVVRPMDDVTFLEALTVTNGQREDVNPIEEADGYRAWMDETRESVSELSLRIGKSPTYVYARLKLLQLSAAVREALSRELISLEHALELGKVREDAQAVVLRECFTLNPELLAEAGQRAAAPYAEPSKPASDEKTEAVESEEDEADEQEEEEQRAFAATVNPLRDVCDALRLGSNMSRRFADKSYRDYARPTVAQMRSYMAERVYVQLARAPFDTRDAELVPSAGACTMCLKRSGAAPELFAELQGHDVCLDGACYQRKVTAHIDAVVDRESAGTAKVVRVSKEWKPKSPVVPIADYEQMTAPVPGSVVGVWVDGLHVGTVAHLRPLRDAQPAVTTKPATSKKIEADDEQYSYAVVDACCDAVRYAVLQQIQREPLPAEDALRGLARVVALAGGREIELDAFCEALMSIRPQPVDELSHDDAAVLLAAELAAAESHVVQRAFMTLLLSGLQPAWNDGSSYVLPDELLMAADLVDVDATAIAKDAEKAYRKAQRSAKAAA